MLADCADHGTVTADRLDGTADAVAGLQSAVVTHLVSGERPKFCFECHEDGVGLGDPENTVEPELGGVYCFTDLRVYLQLGLSDGDKSLSIPYGDISAVHHREGRRRHRIDLAVSDTDYFLWVPSSFDAEDVARAAEYATYRRKAETPDTGAGERSRDSQNLQERLKRLGDAKSRGLIDEQEFQHRKEQLLDE
jgi:hypothetical protein